MGRKWTDEQRRARSEGMRAIWARYTPEEREARVAATRKAQRTGPHSQQHRERLSASIRAAWDRGLTFKSRICRGCSVEYMPRSGSQVYCTLDCRAEHRTPASYKLTAAEYQALFGRQDGRCALCGRDHYGFRSGTKRPLVVDHCHETGKVRGLLCGDCNTALGRFGDDPVRLRRAADYLEGRLTA